MPIEASLTRRWFLASLCALGGLVTGCGTETSTEKKTVALLAAASTREVMHELALRFERETGISVTVSTGSSNALAQQIVSGAPADVYLSANRQWIDEIDQAGLVAEQRLLFSNELVLIVPKDRAGSFASPDDLRSSALERIALAGENVPAGKYAEQALRSLGFFDALRAAGKIVRGHDVRQTLSFVERGEVDAGIVYATDARLSDAVVVAFRFDAATHEPIEYPLALLKSDRDNPVAKQFFEYLCSDTVAEVITKYGFRPAPSGKGD